MSSTKEKKSDLIEEEPLQYGWFGWNPKGLQCLNTALWYLAWMLTANTFQVN